MRAYVYDNQDPADQRAPHDLGISKTVEDLEKVGVKYWRIDGENAIDKIDEIAKERHYKNRDTIVVSPDAMGPIYEDKVKSFFDEHLHEDEEIRYILDGSGYFDVRDQDDVWVRIFMERGDMIILPAGIYHRFTTDENNYIKAMRLFKEDPVWTPLNRPVLEDNKFRLDYVKTYSVSTR
ncbi:Acireductone dioxygenase ARD family [Gilbertella persicaria]|uniref:Acireductone dioxygenase ARD family n=1 Tax=Gilbertella persicaria TaxID=101096 RepID=UPI00222055EC|nr:Acireductone dioxygenase ARD family [Gilbertella persicaria]KAI8083209.1 Acireductone dioxygenase ARD family [Gilbertella persicaria]